MIKRIYVDNFKSLVNFELPLQELTLLMGVNGAGKTSVLDAIFAIRQLLSGSAKVGDKSIFPAATLTRWQSIDRQVFEFDVVLDDDDYRYRLEVEHERQSRKVRIAVEQLELAGSPLFRFKEGEVRLYRDDHSEGPTFSADWSESALSRIPPRRDNRRLTRFLDFMRNVVVCNLYPPRLAAESSTEDAVLQRNAENFAAWYRNLLLERPEQLTDLTQALQDVIGGFRGIRMEKVGLDARALMVTFERQERRFELRFDEISDGERALIVLYSLIRLAAGQGYALFLDEPDNFVALRELQPWLFALSDACPADVPQAVICSHHPELIDYLGHDRGRLLERESTGVTRVKQLAAPAEGDLRLSETIARGWES